MSIRRLDKLLEGSNNGQAILEELHCLKAITRETERHLGQGNGLEFEISGGMIGLKNEVWKVIRKAEIALMESGPL